MLYIENPIIIMIKLLFFFILRYENFLSDLILFRFTIIHNIFAIFFNSILNIYQILIFFINKNKILLEYFIFIKVSKKYNY